MFGVVICPRCHRVRGVDLGSRRATCPGCGGSIDVSRAKIYFKTEDLRELSEAVRQKAREISTPLDGGGSDDWSQELAGEGAAPIRLDEQGLFQAALDLTRELGDFTLDQIMEKLGIEDHQRVHDLLQRMLREGMIYEPEPGRYRAV